MSFVSAKDAMAPPFSSEEIDLCESASATDIITKVYSATDIITALYIYNFKRGDPPSPHLKSS